LFFYPYNKSIKLREALKTLYLFPGTLFHNFSFYLIIHEDLIYKIFKQK
jgi:hypothetical protein